MQERALRAEVRQEPQVEPEQPVERLAASLPELPSQVVTVVLVLELEQILELAAQQVRVLVLGQPPELAV